MTDSRDDAALAEAEERTGAIWKGGVASNAVADACPDYRDSTGCACPGKPHGDHFQQLAYARAYHAALSAPGRETTPTDNDEAWGIALYGAFRNSQLAQVRVERWEAWENLAQWAKWCWRDIGSAVREWAVSPTPTPTEPEPSEEEPLTVAEAVRLRYGARGLTRGDVQRVYDAMQEIDPAAGEPEHEYLDAVWCRVLQRLAAIGSLLPG